MGEAAIADLRRQAQNPALLDPAVDLGDPSPLGYFARASLFCGTETGEWGRNLIQDFRVHDFHSPDSPQATAQHRPVISGLAWRDRYVVKLMPHAPMPRPLVGVGRLLE